MRSKIDPTLTIEKIQRTPENQYFDRKSARLAPKDLAHHISAMANASGGVIVLGVEDDGTITGVDSGRENEFRKVPFEFLKTIPNHVVEMLPVNAQLGVSSIMLVHVAPSADEIIMCKNGEAYLRVGDSSRKLNTEQLLALEYSKGIKSYESRVVSEANLDDLDGGLIEEYNRILDPSVSKPLDILKARGLIKERDGTIQITVAAILLFGKVPTQFLPSARVRFLKYEGTTRGVGVDFNVEKDITLEKPLHYLLTDAKQILALQMREFQQLGRDGRFRRVPEYPEFAWLEGLVNAVTHRDYSISGDYIRVSMFDDRIEFLSPGKLPNIVTVQNIQNTRFSRNPLIARVLSDFGWVRELNEGVKRIYTDMESFFLEPPVFSEPNGKTVQLVLKNNIAMRSMRRLEALKSITSEEWNSMSQLDRDIIFYVANIEHCTPRVLEHLTQKSRQTLVQHLKALSTKNGGPIEEHCSSPRDPTKYYTIR